MSGVKRARYDSGDATNSKRTKEDPMEVDINTAQMIGTLQIKEELKANAESVPAPPASTDVYFMRKELKPYYEMALPTKDPSVFKDLRNQPYNLINGNNEIAAVSFLPTGVELSTLNDTGESFPILFQDGMKLVYEDSFFPVRYNDSGALSSIRLSKILIPSERMVKLVKNGFVKMIETNENKTCRRKLMARRKMTLRRRMAPPRIIHKIRSLPAAKPTSKHTQKIKHNILTATIDSFADSLSCRICYSDYISERFLCAYCMMWSCSECGWKICETCPFCRHKTVALLCRNI